MDSKLQVPTTNKYLPVLLGIGFMGAILCGLAILGRWNYVIFHTLVELFSVGVGIAMFMIAWNVRKLMKNDFLLFVAMSYAAVCLLDLMHTLAYSGMGAIPGVTIDEPTQLWIAARYLQAICLLTAPLWLTRKLSWESALLLLGVFDCFILLSIFHPSAWPVRFPTCHLGARGLTNFKVVSEYIISGILLVALGFLWLRRSHLDKAVFVNIAVAMAVTVVSEIAFTSYVSVKAPSNMVGHLLKVVAVYLTYRALISAGLKRPFDVLFRGLADSEQRYRMLTAATFEGIAVTKQGRFVDFNDQLAKMLGYTREELLGREVALIIHPDDLSKVLDHIRGGEESHVEHRMQSKDDRWLTIEARWQTVVIQGENVRFATFRDITERKRAVETLQESEENYRRIVETANEGIMTADVSGKITFVNAKMASMLGYEIAELIGKPGLTLVCPEESESSLGRIEKRKAGSTESYDIKFIHKNGNILWAHASGAPICSREGQHIGNLGMYADITAQKHAEDDLAFQARLLSDVREAVFSSDCNYTITYWNKAAEKMYGWTREEALGKNSGELLKPKVEATSLETERSKMRSAGHWEGEAQYIRKDGTYLFVEVTSTALKDTHGGDLGNVVVSRDITERKQAEEAIRTSELNLRGILNATKETIWVFSADGHILQGNPTAFARLGKSSEEVIGKEVADVVPPDIIQARLERLQEVVKSMQPLDFEDKRADIFFHHSFYPIFDNAGRVSSVVSFSRDITERKRAEEELRIYAANLASANKELESYSYSISHDLRSPLRAMKVFSNFLLEDYSEKLDATAQNYIKRIIVSSDKMSELIDDILSLSKISRQEMIPQEINISTSAEAVANVLRQGDPTNKVKLVIAQDMKTQGDSRLITIALTNLIGNAWKYSSKTPDALIEFGAVEKDGREVYFVRDNGAGFNMAFADKLFEPFRRLHSESEFPGTGIGLAIVKRVIERHKGTVWAESEVGKGATFYFTLLFTKNAIGG